MTNSSILDEIIVTGVRYQSDLNRFTLSMYYTDGSWQANYHEYDVDQGSNQPAGPPRNENGFTEDEQESLLDQLKIIEAVLKEQIRDGRANTVVVVGGRDFTVGSLVESFGRTIELIEAGMLAYEISQGNASVGDVVSFVGGALFGGALLAAGVSPIGVLIAAGVFGAGLGALTDTYLASLGNSLRDSFNLAGQQIANNEPPLSLNEYLAQLLLRWFTPNVDSGEPPYPTYPSYPNPTGPTYNEP